MIRSRTTCSTHGGLAAVALALVAAAPASEGKLQPHPAQAPRPAKVKELRISRFDGLAMDPAGATFLAGTFGPSTQIDEIALQSKGSVDLVVARYDPARRAATWAVDLGGPGEKGDPTDQLATGVAVTADGTVAVIGSTTGGLAGKGIALPKHGQQDFLIGLNGANGAGKWAEAFSDGLNGALLGVASSPRANLIAICGYTDQADPDIDPAAKAFGGGARDAILAVYDSAGVRQWSKQLGSGSDEECDAIAMDDSGDVYVAGKYNGAPGKTRLDPGLGRFPDPGNPNRRYIWLAKYRGSDGKPMAQASFGSGNGNQTPKSLAIDGGGHLVLGGQFNNSLRMGGTTLESGGRLDGFVSKLSVSGATFSSIWAVRLGGTDVDVINGVAVTSSGDVVAVGTFGQKTSGAAVLVSEGSSDALLLELDGETGATRFAARYGDWATQGAEKVVANRLGAGAAKDLVAFGGGYTGKVRFPPLEDRLETTVNRGYLVFAPLAPLPSGVTHW